MLATATTRLSVNVKRRLLEQANEVGDPRHDQKVARAFDVVESGLVVGDLLAHDTLWAVRIRSARTDEVYVVSDKEFVAYVDDAGELVNEGGKGVKCTCPAGRKGVFCYHQLVCTCRRLSLKEDADAAEREGPAFI